MKQINYPKIYELSYDLAMLVLQSDFYLNSEAKNLVDKILDIYRNFVNIKTQGKE
jgi:hypothetical protein